MADQRGVILAAVRPQHLRPGEKKCKGPGVPQGSMEEGWPEPGLCHVREGTIGREVGATFFRAAQAMHGVQFDFYLCEREGAHQITPQNSP